MKDERLENDQVLGSWLSNLQQLEVFQAQIELENRILNASLTKLQNLDIKSPSLELEYASVKSTIETIKRLQSGRDYLIENRNKNNRNPA